MLRPSLGGLLAAVALEIAATVASGVPPEAALAPARSASAVAKKAPPLKPGEIRAIHGGFFEIDNRELGPMPVNRVHGDGWPTQDVTMPYVHGGAPGVADRINAALYFAILGEPPPATRGSDLPLADPDPALPDSVEFRVLRNDSRLLSFAFETSACGGRCLTYTQRVHFDSRTGDRVELADLLTPQGVALARITQAKAALAAYDDGLARLPPDPNALPADADADDDDAPRAVEPPAATASPPMRPIDLDDDSDGSEHRAFFEECERPWYEVLPEYAPEGKTPDGEAPDFELRSDGSLHMSVPQCAYNRRGLVLEEEIDLSTDIALPAARLAPFATPYGRTLIASGPDAPRPDDAGQRLLRGRVGSANVTMILGRQANDACQGAYWYDRYRLAIGLSGSCTPGHLVLKEWPLHGAAQRGVLLEHSQQLAGVFDLRRQGAGYAGTWHDAKRRLPVTLAP
jgi:hypothetical protein